MTIVKNRYFVGQEVYYPSRRSFYTIEKIESGDLNELFYGLTHYEDLEVYESDLFESKEAYEAEKNQIRVGDEFYYLDTDETDDNLKIYKQKCEAFSQNDAYIFNENNRRRPVCSCFKTKELLLQAVQKAVEECE
jgi:hypothetical protein